MVWVPLESNVGGGECSSQGPFIGVCEGRERRRHGFLEDLRESLSTQPNREGNFLPRLGSPRGSIHHPEKVRLDPAHSFEAEIASKLTVLQCIFGDRRSVRLID